MSSQSDYFSFGSLESHCWLFTFACQLQGKDSKLGDIFNSSPGPGEREKCYYWKRFFCEGAVIYILNRCKLSSLPTPKFSNILIIQYLVRPFFLAVFWFSVKFRRLWFGKRYEDIKYLHEGLGYLSTQEVVIFSQQWSICQSKKRSLTRTSFWTYNSSLLEWKRIELLCLLVLNPSWRAASSC